MGADLFGWQELQAAQAAVAAAHAERDLAARRARYAPHGCRREREALLAAATRRALAAEIDLSAVERDVRS